LKRLAIRLKLFQLLINLLKLDNYLIFFYMVHQELEKLLLF